MHGICIICYFIIRFTSLMSHGEFSDHFTKVQELMKGPRLLLVTGDTQDAPWVATQERVYSI